MIKVGLIGAGRITNAHRKAYAALREAGTDVRVVAVADVRPEMTEPFRENERIYGDYSELLEAEVGKLDYVDICLPTFLHAPAAVKALNMGYNVLCEKPMAIDTESAQAMCDAAKKNGRLLMIAHSRRFFPVFDNIRKILESGELGPVKYAQFNQMNGTPQWSWEGWHFDENRSRGAFFDLIHDIDLMNCFFGVPKTVSCLGQKNWPGSGYDYGAMLFGYDNGLFASVIIDWTTENLKFGNAAKVFVCEKGYIYKGDFDGRSVFVKVDGDGKETEIPSEGPTPYYREIAYYIDCLVNHKPIVFNNPEGSRDNIRIVSAAYRSADLGGVRVDI